MEELLECPVCLDMMARPKKIYHCCNGHIICGPCKDNPEVSCCPTCRVEFTPGNLSRNIIAEKLAEKHRPGEESTNWFGPIGRFIVNQLEPIKDTIVLEDCDLLEINSTDLAAELFGKDCNKNSLSNS